MQLATHGRMFRWVPLSLVALGCSASSNGDVAEPNAVGGSGASTASGGVSGSGAAPAIGGTGGLFGSGGATAAESCNGLDDDQDGQIDEICACTSGQMQDCYPGAAQPPEGCYWGKQTCVGPDWSNAPCQGATLPPEGKTICCSVTGPMQHPLLDAFMAAYPFAAMPQNVTEIQNFSPTASGYSVKWSQSISGNEFIDPGKGGVIPQNVEIGRDASYDAAMLLVPSGASVIDTKEPPIVIEPLTGSGSCAAMGWGWGSLLFETASHAVGEIVYLYIGYCSAYGADGIKVTGIHGDVEGFYVSDAPAELCEEPRIPVPN